MATARLTSSPVRGSVVDDDGSPERLGEDVAEELDDVVAPELTAALELLVDGVAAGAVDGLGEGVLGDGVLGAAG